MWMATRATQTYTGSLRELDARQSNGIEVSLLWDPSDDSICVDVHDTRTGESLRLPVPPSRALDVFQHPLAYAAAQGLPESAMLLESEALA